MKTAVVWKSGMEFDGQVDGHVVPMDAKAPLGKGAAATPKELVAIGLAGCTAMDVIALLKKYKQWPESFHIDVDVTTSVGEHPAIFEKANLNFIVDGSVSPEKLNDAVKLSQTKYCGVSAMLAKAFLIEYRVILNGELIGSGVAEFES